MSNLSNRQLKIKNFLKQFESEELPSPSINQKIKEYHRELYIHQQLMRTMIQGISVVLKDSNCVNDMDWSVLLKEEIPSKYLQNITPLNNNINQPEKHQNGVDQLEKLYYKIIKKIDKK